MNFKEIEAIVTIASSSSFYEAAYTLNYSPSVISKYVANIERELGVELFVRGRRAAVLTLTKEGEALIPYFTQVHEACKQLYGGAEALRPKDGGYLRIGTGYYLSSLGMDAILADFFSVRPDIRVLQTKLDFESRIHALYSGQQDGVFVLAQEGSPNFTTLMNVTKDSKVESFLVVRERDMYLSVSERYFPGVTSAPFSAFQDFQIVFHSNPETLDRSGTMIPFVNLSRRCGFELKTLYTDPRDTSAHYLATQRKIAIPSLRGAFKYPGTRLIRIEDWDSFSMSYFLTLKSNRNPELRQFKKSVSIYLGQGYTEESADMDGNK